jgi:hypothetical protein
MVSKDWEVHGLKKARLVMWELEVNMTSRMRSVHLQCYRSQCQLRITFSELFRNNSKGLHS